MIFSRPWVFFATEIRLARQWREEYEGALYHVLSRGNEGRPIVADDKDRAAFLEILGRMAARFEVEVLPMGDRVV